MIIISNQRAAGPLFAVALLLYCVPAGGLQAQNDPVPAARRIGTVASIALDEYAQGVTDGRVVREEEFVEARLFLDEALRAAEDLPPAAREAALPVLQTLLEGLEALRPVDELQAGLMGLRETLERVLEIRLDPLPSSAPSLAQGADLFGELCATCHGARGAGDGILAAGMEPSPSDLTDRKALRKASPIDFFRKINVGVAGTAMPGFEGQIDLAQRWALALYASSLRFGDGERAAGENLLGVRCPACVGVVADFSQTAPLADDSLAALIAGLSDVSPNDSETPGLVAYARTAGAVEGLGGDESLTAARTVAATKAQVARAVQSAIAGESAAASRGALDAYLVFEGIETALRARDPSAAARVERAFGDLRARIAEGDARGVSAAHPQVNAALDAALESLTVASSAWMLFGQSFVIMLREGLEAILIIGALVAFLAKTGAPHRQREIGWGVVAALAASVVTAVLFGTLMRHAPAEQEALEGTIMLVAAAVLFWVSYWLVSKIEVRKWQRFVQEQMRRALSGGGVMTLAAVAFLAVYREGFETVLFYAALFASAKSGAVSPIAGGMVVGLGLLAAVYVLIQRFGMKLPLRPFFAVTSALLYFMAFSFAGQGVAELQEAGYIEVTPLGSAPAVPALGIFPTLQTLGIQLVLATAFLFALVWIFWIGPRRQSHQVVTSS